MGKLLLYFVINFMVLVKLVVSSDVVLTPIESGLRKDPSQADVVGINLSSINNRSLDNAESLNNLLISIRHISKLDNIIIGMKDENTPILSLDKNILNDRFLDINNFLKIYQQSVVLLDVDGFVSNNGKLSINSKDLPEYVHHLVIKDPKKRVKVIGKNFLADNNLESINLSELKAVEEIKSDFLRGSKNIEKVDFSGFYNVKKIGDNFMDGCLKIEQINLDSLLKELIEFGDNAFRRCINLKALNLKNATKLQKVGDGFLSGNKIISANNVSFPLDIDLGVEGKPSKNLIALSKILEQIAFDIDVDSSGVVEDGNNSTRWKRLKKLKKFIKDNSGKIAAGVVVTGVVHLVTFLIILL